MFNEDEDINTLLRKAEETIRENITDYLQYDEVLSNSHDRRNLAEAGITTNNSPTNTERNKRQDEVTAPPVSNVNGNRNHLGNINTGDIILIDSSPSTTLPISWHRYSPISRKRQRRTRYQQRRELFPDPVHIINLDDYDDSTPLHQNVIINETNNNRANVERSSTEGNSNARTLSVKCAICLELIQSGKAASTICGHVFCKSCILRTFEMTKKCPLCNRKLNKNAIHPLYLE